MIKFECQRCGNCCKETLGWVYVTAFEIERISEFLKVSTFDFINNYLIKNKGWFVLSSPRHNKNCFLENNLCKIYPVRPTNCQKYPFWENVLQNRQSFLKEAETCKALKSLLNSAR